MSVRRFVSGKNERPTVQGKDELKEKNRISLSEGVERCVGVMNERQGGQWAGRKGKGSEMSAGKDV